MRLPASIAPVHKGAIATIRMTCSVVVLTRPNATGALRLEVPRGAIEPRQCFALNYVVHGRARRALAQCLRVIPVGSSRELAKVRLLSDAEGRAERGGSLRGTGPLQPLATVVRAARIPAGAAFPLEVRDVARRGVGFDCVLPVVVKDQLELVLGGEKVSVEVSRAQLSAPTPFDAQIADDLAGGRFFAACLTTIWTEPTPVEKPVARPAAEAPPAPAKRLGMATRRDDG